MRTIVSVQILRAVAASAVVVAHAQSWISKMTGAPQALLDLHFLGGFAVDLFFVISGFIMVYTSEPMFGRPEGPKTFFLHRLVRIVPLYWIVTAAYIALSLAFPQFGRSYGLDFIIASFLFIPMLNADGEVMPIVGHGWTLNHEMLFYALFALAVFAPRRLAVGLVSALLVAAVILGERVAPSSTAMVFWTSPVVLQFVFGMAIGLLYREGVRLWKPLSLALIIAGFAWIFRNAMSGVPHHAPLYSLPATLMVAGATFGSFSLEGPVWRSLARIGDASYAIYLLHSAPIRAALLLSRSTFLDFASAPWLYAVLAVIGAVALGMATYYVFERPVTRYLRGLLKPRKLAEASTPRLVGVPHRPE
jgi:peptidoglycan/LPS O-acetylase OafA/YrhL